MSDAINIDDGGAAYPIIPPLDQDGMSASGYPYPANGLTKRDYFAAAALAGLLASPNDSLYRYVIETAKATSPAPTVAGLAYELADAMIAASKSEVDHD